MADTFIVDGRPFVAEIAELLSAVFQPSEVEDALGRGRTWRVCVNADGDVLGFIAWERVADYLWWDLKWLAVDGSHYGQGIGRRLCDRLKAEVVRNGGKGIRVETPCDSAAREFYERCGFELATMIPDFYEYDRGLALYTWYYDG